MKDTEKPVIKAFLSSLVQQKNSLPSQVQTQLNNMADSWEENVIELHNMALNTPTLKEPYEMAYSWLLNQARERGMGLDFLPANSSEDDFNSDIENVTRDITDDLKKLEDLAENIDKKLKINKILSSQDSVKEAKQQLS